MPQSRVSMSRSIRDKPSSLMDGELGVVFPQLPCLHLSCHFLLDFSIPSCAEDAHSVLSSPSRWTDLCVGTDLVRIMVEVGSNSLFATIFPEVLVTVSSYKPVAKENVVNSAEWESGSKVSAFHQKARRTEATIKLVPMLWLVKRSWIVSP